MFFHRSRKERKKSLREKKFPKEVIFIEIWQLFLRVAAKNDHFKELFQVYKLSVNTKKIILGTFPLFNFILIRFQSDFY